MRDRRHFWTCVGVMLVGGTAATAWPGNEPAPATSSARTARPVRAQDCTVKLFEEAVLSCERPGILSALSVRGGETVHEGQLLAQLKDDVAKAALAVAEAEAGSDIEIRFAQAANAVAEVKHLKMVAVNERAPQTIPELEIKEARLAADKTRLEIEKAEHTREIYRLKRDEAAVQLATFRIEAPFEGFVTRVHLSKGAFVKQGDPVIEIVSTKIVRVEGYVDVGDLAVVRAGAKVSVHLTASEVGAEGAKQSYPGKIVFVDVKSTPVEHKVRVWAEVENLENNLRAGLTPVMLILPPGND